MSNISSILLVRGFADHPWDHASAFIASILAAAKRLQPMSDVVGMDAIAALPNVHATTLLGLAASPRVTSPADYLAQLILVNRPAQWRMAMVDELDPPIQVPNETAFAYKNRWKTWQNALVDYDTLRAQIILHLTPEMRAAIEAFPQVELTVADIIARIRTQYVDTVPSDVQDRQLELIAAKIDPQLEVEANLQLFERSFDALHPDLQQLYPNHRKVDLFLGKLSGDDLTAVTTKIQATHPTNATKHWNQPMRELIKLELLGARERRSYPIASPFAAAAVVQPPPVPPAPATPPVATAQKAYCFLHGYGYHPTIKCTAMIQTYGPYDATNDHAAKYECFNGGKNINGVTSSSRTGTTQRHQRNGERGGGRGGGRGNGREKG